MTVDLIFSSILIIGDSNVRRIRDEIVNDQLLGEFDITFLAFGGLRSNELGPMFSLAAAQYDYVIVACGNNDLAPFRNRPAASPLDVCANLASFANVLKSKGVECVVFGMARRGDSEIGIVQETNFLLHSALGNRYVPCKLKIKHMEETDDVHFNFNGRRDFLALLLRVIKKRFGL